MKIMVAMLLGFMVYGCTTPCYVADKEAASKFVITCMSGAGFTNTVHHQNYCEEMMRRIYCNGPSVLEKP